MRNALLIWTLILALLAPVVSLPGSARSAGEAAVPAGYVDPFIGTGGAGNTYPAAQAPFGMIQPGPDTSRRKGGAGYDYEDPYIQSFSLTHLSGVGCDAASDLPFIPTIKPLDANPVRNRTAYQDTKVREAAAPGYYQVRLGESGIGFETAAAVRASIVRLDFPDTGEASVLFVPPNSTKSVSDSALRVHPDRRSVSGWARSGEFCGSTNRYTIFFHAEFDTPFLGFGAWEDGKRAEQADISHGESAAMYVRFGTNSPDSVRMKLGISFVSEANAKENIDAEIPHWDLSRTRQETFDAWNELLGKIRLSGGTEEEYRSFYTALYHVFLQPSVFNDVNGEYIGFDDRIRRVEDGHRIFAGFSLWDTYRTQAQLLALLAPEAASDMVRSLLLNAEQTIGEGGGLPGWGYYNDDPNIMSTYPAPLFIANAYAFGATNFDREAMKSKLIEVATSTNPLKKAASPDGEGAQWWGLEHYIERGYTDSVSDTIEYAMTDFAIAMFSRALGDDPNYRHFLDRSQNVFHLFNPNASPDGGYLQRKDESGQWIMPFSPTDHAGFLEGNSAQYTWVVPHNVERLIRLMGGKGPFAHRLDAHLSRYVRDGWPTDSPYWWSGNEPGMGVPYLFNWAGLPWNTQSHIDRILRTQWNASSSGIPGNDDTGTASAWYVWSTLGLYPSIPGVAGFTLSTPRFPKVELTVRNGVTITMRTASTGWSSRYIRGMNVNGEPHTRSWITLDRLTAGGGAVLDYVLGDTPSDWGTGTEDVPPSFAPDGEHPNRDGGGTARLYEQTEQATATVWEAEEAFLDGTRLDNRNAGYSGSGYVSGFERDGARLVFSVTVDEAGYYPLTIGYASPFGDKINSVLINGGIAGDAAFPQSETFTQLKFGDVALRQGGNTIELRKDWGYFDVDYIRLGLPRERRAVIPPEPRPVTPQASRQAVALMRYFASIYGKAVLAGQQISSAAERKYLLETTGTLPVIAGFDAAQLGDDALEWAASGGVVASEWHWPAPMGGGGYYAADTDFDVSRAVTPGTEEHDRTLRELDRMAERLKRFQAAGVPVLWRPLHEAEGRWFWWGAKGPEPAKALYRLMFDRFVHVHGLNHLIWIWTTVHSPDAAQWYPGDDYVDLIGVDKYITVDDYNPMLTAYDEAVALTGGRKMAVFSENGAIPDPQALLEQKVGWLFFNTWHSQYLMDEAINTKEHLRHVYRHPYVITLDEFPAESIYR